MAPMAKLKTMQKETIMSVKLKGSLVLMVGMLICLSLGIEGYAKGNYPNKPVKVIVPYSAGGDTDLVTRLWAGSAEKILGVPVVVINKAGGSGAIAANFVSKAKPDGYTIMAACTTPNLITPNFTKVTFGLDNFSPICLFVSSEMGLVVKSDSSYKTFDDFIKGAKKNPGKISISTYGATSASTIYSKIWSGALGIDLKYVHYKGAAPAMVAMLGGHVDSTMSLPQVYGPHVKANKARILFQTLKSKKYPNVPTLQEYGVKGDYTAWNGFFAPAGTPAPIVKKLAEVTKKVCEDHDVIKAIANTGGTLRFQSGAEWDESLKKQYKEIAEIAKRLRK
jgi:tripartite-type tricarboxylate transporter receptor subunit TctC